VSYISTLEALDVSQISLLNLILAQHLGILNKSWMPCSSTPFCFLLLYHQVTTIFMVDLDLLLGLLFSSYGLIFCFLVGQDLAR
jgi:hypothetical protein